MKDVYVASHGHTDKEKPITAKEDHWWKEVIRIVLEDTGERKRNILLRSFCVLPDLKFVTQQDDEEIVLLLRAHPITNIGWLLLSLVMLALPTVLMATGMFSNVNFEFIFIGRLTWYLVILMYSFEKFLHWYYSVFIITNERLVDIDFYNLMFRIVTYANLNHIEEPASITGGFIRSMFKYGDIYVTTASEKPTVEALAVPYPDKVIDIISRLSEELEKRRERGE
jgi:membrane protein YdbS with pleckstrin-like domain